jgi:hypothetical protein
MFSSGKAKSTVCSAFLLLRPITIPYFCMKKSMSFSPFLPCAGGASREVGPCGDGPTRRRAIDRLQLGKTPLVIDLSQRAHEGLPAARRHLHNRNALPTGRVKPTGPPRFWAEIVAAANSLLMGGSEPPGGTTSTLSLLEGQTTTRTPQAIR